MASNPAICVPSLLVPSHVSYIQKLGESQDDLAYHLTSHLRLNAVYWGLTALCIMEQRDALDRQQLLDFVMSCWDDKAGAFGAHPRHDGHILPTLSGIQILIMLDALHLLDVESKKDRIVSFILGLQHPTNGSFAGDRFGETDTRFLYCAVSALSLLGCLDRIDKDRTVSYIRRCKNFDGGYGSDAGGESHASQVWTCVGALAILDRLDEVETEPLAWWLSERQLPNGGLNGRPEKLEDVCYSFWVLSSLSILNRMPWIDGSALERFILSSQVRSRFQQALFSFVACSKAPYCWVASDLDAEKGHGTVT